MCLLLMVSVSLLSVTKGSIMLAQCLHILHKQSRFVIDHHWLSTEIFYYCVSAQVSVGCDQWAVQCPMSVLTELSLTSSCHLILSEIESCSRPKSWFNFKLNLVSSTDRNTWFKYKYHFSSYFTTIDFMCGAALNIYLTHLLLAHI